MGHASSALPDLEAVPKTDPRRSRYFPLGIHAPGFDEGPAGGVNSALPSIKSSTPSNHTSSGGKLYLAGTGSRGPSLKIHATDQLNS